MTDVTIHGFPQSTYTWTVRLACEEKGVSHELAPAEFGTEALGALHPFQRIPALEHGGFKVYESLACAAYVDEAFDGPALQPTDPKEHARMLQLITSLIDYGYRPMVHKVVINRLVTPSRGGETDEAALAEALPDVRHFVGVIEAALAEGDYLAGGAAPTLADWFYAPCLFWFEKTPEGAEMLAACPNIQAWRQRIESRPSFDATAPAPPPQADAAQ